MEEQGLIGFVSDRKTAKGLTTYSFTFEDREDKRWFGTYTTEPPPKGTYVKFEYTTNGAGFHNVDSKTLKIVEPDGDDGAAEQSDEVLRTPNSRRCSGRAGFFV